MNVHQRVVSLWEMLELNASAFLSATTQIARIRQILVNVDSSSERDTVLNQNSIDMVSPALETFYTEASKVGAKLSCLSAERLYAAMKNEPCCMTLREFADGIKDIESRFADQLNFVKLFIISENEYVLFEGAQTLLSSYTANLYPSIWFDCEEAAKCLGLGRATASVFHAMRVLEIALSAISKRLNIPDPSKATDRNWGNMLRSIKLKMDEQYPPKDRIKGSAGTKLEGIYASLDAVKNPWRNGTMHVDAVYTEEEARHILSCTGALIGKMSAIFDENGEDSPSPELDLEPVQVS